MSIATEIPVIYRHIDDEVVAILPTVETNQGRIMTYVHVGQHGEACPSWVIRGRLAKPDEYKALHQELCARYEPDTLVVRKRINWDNWRNRNQ
jgi:hypothetical protein